MKIKRSEVFGLENAFNSLMEVRLDPEVAYKIASNGIIANELADKIRKTYTPIDGYGEIEEQRREIIIKAGGKKEPNGTFAVNPDQANRITSEVKAFEEKHKVIIDAQKRYQEKFNEFLDKKVDVDFKTIERKELTAAIEPAKLVLMIKVGILTDGDK